MARHKLDNYLRTVRKHRDLSQRELGFLLGAKSGEPISRYEHGVRLPNPDTLLTYEIVFGIAVRELLAGRFEQIERSVTTRIRKLIAKLERDPQTARSQRKIAELKRIVAREPDYQDDERQAA